MKIKDNRDLKKMYKVKTDNKMRWFGDTDLDKKVIRVNRKRSRKSGRPGEVLDTIVHEVQHAKHPRMSESGVRKKTVKVIKNLTKRQKKSYYNL